MLDIQVAIPVITVQLTARNSKIAETESGRFYSLPHFYIILILGFVSFLILLSHFEVLEGRTFGNWETVHKHFHSDFVLD